MVTNEGKTTSWASIQETSDNRFVFEKPIKYHNLASEEIMEDCVDYGEIEYEEIEFPKVEMDI